MADMMQIMSNMKGTPAALPMAGQVVGSGSRVSKRGGAAGGGRRKQSGKYAGMTGQQIRRRKREERANEASETRQAELDDAYRTGLAEGQVVASAAEQNRDGGDGTALLENPQEGLDVNPDGGGQASMDLDGAPSPNLGSQARSGRGSRSPGPSGSPVEDIFDDEGNLILPEPVPEGEGRSSEGNEPYRHPNYHR